MTTTDRVTLLVAAMLTGQTSPGDELIKQCITLAGVAVRVIEEKHDRTGTQADP